MPVRIQRKRSKGWKMPPNTVYVGRPTRWGNPFAVHGDGYPMSARMAVQAFREMIIAEDQWFSIPSHKWPAGKIPKNATAIADIKRELRGKDLACWCPLGQPCHADVLLEIANA